MRFKKFACFCTLHITFSSFLKMKKIKLIYKYTQMHKITLIILLIFLSLSINAQEVGVEFGKVMSSFDYKNSDGEVLDNMQGTTNNHLGLIWKMPLNSTSWYFASSLSYTSYGATGSDYTVNNYYVWDVNYVGIDVGLGYEFFKYNYLNFRQTGAQSGITFSIHISGGPEFLVQGTQTINHETCNIVGIEQFDKPFIYANGGIGIKYYASKTFSINAQFEGGKSFSVFKSDSDDAEKLNYIVYTFSVGLSISLLN